METPLFHRGRDYDSEPSNSVWEQPAIPGPSQYMLISTWASQFIYHQAQLRERRDTWTAVHHRNLLTFRELSLLLP